MSSSASFEFSDEKELAFKFKKMVVFNVSYCFLSVYD